MSFQISSIVDESKVFLISQNDIEARLDVEYYQPYHFQDLKRLEKSPYNLKKLDHICTRIVDGPFGSAIKASDYVEQGIPFIRVAEVTHGEGTIKTDKLIYISEEAHEKIKRSKVVPNDVVIAKTGATMGAASVIPESIIEANIRGDLGALTVKNNECTPEYVITYINTDLGQRLFWRLDSGGTRGRVVIGNLKKYPILVPPLNIQDEIVSKINKGYSAKKQKEVEAQQLLDSIDDYLLAELGIKLPEQEENTVQSRIFTRQLSEVSGGRFDPKLYDNKTVNLKKSIKGSNFTKCTLKELVVESVAGDWGKELDSDVDGFSKCLVIRATEFDNLFNLNLNNKRLKYRLINDKKLLKISVNENDLLIEKSGGSPDQPVGRVAIITTEVLNKASAIGYSNFIQKIRIDKIHISPSYLFCFLKTIHSIGLTDAMQSQTNGIRNLIMGNYYEQKIPLPPLEKQTEIANYITKIRSKAKSLQQQAKEELEQAKKEVEAMILGEDAKKV